jgi:hypothetical protein
VEPCFGKEGTDRDHRDRLDGPVRRSRHAPRCFRRDASTSWNSPTISTRAGASDVRRGGLPPSSRARDRTYLEPNGAGVIDRLFDLFASRGSARYDEEVTQLGHALQAAALAQDERAAPRSLPRRSCTTSGISCSPRMASRWEARWICGTSEWGRASSRGACRLPSPALLPCTSPPSVSWWRPTRHTAISCRRHHGGASAGREDRWTAAAWRFSDVAVGAGGRSASETGRRREDDRSRRAAAR